MICMAAVNGLAMERRRAAAADRAACAEIEILESRGARICHSGGEAAGALEGSGRGRRENSKNRRTEKPNVTGSSCSCASVAGFEGAPKFAKSVGRAGGGAGCVGELAIPTG